MNTLRAILPVILFFSAVAAAEDDFDRSYDRLRDKTVEKRKSAFEDLKRKIASDARATDEKSDVRAAASTQGGPLRAPGIAEVNATNTLATAQAAIETSVEGTDVGFSVAPLLVAGISTNHQLRLSLGAMKDGRTQVGAAWSYQDTPSITYAELGVTACTLDESALKVEMNSLKAEVRNICEVGIAALGSNLNPLPEQDEQALAREKKVLDSAKETCQGPESAPAFDVAVHTLLKALENAELRSKQTGQDLQGFPDKVRAIRDRIDTLRAFKLPRPDECLTDEVISDAYVQYTWNHLRNKVGASLTAQAFPQLWGFNPDSSPSSSLPSGQISKVAGRFEYNLLYKGLELVAGVGVGAEREKHTDMLRPVVSPSFSVAYAATSLMPGSALHSGGKLTLVKGALPPRVIVGLDLALDYALAPPETQDTPVQGFAATGFLECRFTDDLAVRVGVPIKADIKVREADASQNITEKRALQWSVPVFVTTALKI